MKSILVVGILFGTVWAGLVSADEDFGDDSSEVVIPQVIVVPNVRQERARQAVLDNGLDKDGDGLSDGDEVRLATDANNPDTDGDGYIDGLEVTNGYNPLQMSPEDKVVVTGLEKASPSDVYRVTGVRLDATEVGDTLVVTGVGPVNSLVTLLIPATELKAWVVRTDSSGRFMYVSQDTLAVGQHRVYAAGTAADGAVLAVSSPLDFVRRVDSLEVLTVPSPASEATQITYSEPVVIGGGGGVWIFVATVTSIVSVALIVGGGLFLRRRTR